MPRDTRPLGPQAMTRRQFLRILGVAGAGAVVTGLALRPSRREPNLPAASALPRTLLSNHGSSRATGYANSNKIVTVGSKTHVAWLDATSEGFVVRIRTFDQTRSAWSPPTTVGGAVDNHGGPALAVDGDGYLHIAYGPHAHPMRYRRSKNPNDASEWGDEIEFGKLTTYPTLMVGADNTLYLTCRSADTKTDTYNGQVELWTKRSGEAWAGPRVLVRSRYPGYTHFGESVAWGPDHRTIHLACRIHEINDPKGYGRIQTIGYMVSYDAGRTWRTSGGEVLDLPVTADTIEVIASGGVDRGRILQAGSISVGADGTPYIPYSIQENNTGTCVLARNRHGRRWEQITLNRYLPTELDAWQVCYADGAFVDSAGQLTVVATIQSVRADERGRTNLVAWGHPTNEIVRFLAPNWASPFTCDLVSGLDSSIPQWLANVERSTGFNRVEKPNLLYTAGMPGSTNSELLTTRVYYV